MQRNRLVNRKRVLVERGRLAGAGGIITALLAALPGVIDYLYAVPPQSTGKQRAARHGLVNSGAVVMFIAAWVVRGSATAPPTVVTLLLELVALGLLGIGGWMGGTLV